MASYYFGSSNDNSNSSIIASLESRINTKANLSHSHAISDVTNLQTSLDGKSNTGHTHSIIDILNLQTSLDGKSNTGHTHSIVDILNLQTSLDGKANTSHTHTIANVTNLQTTLDGKANLSGGNTFSGTQNFATVNISGDLTVSGTNTFVNATSLEIQDSMAKIARSNTSTDVVDIGQFGVYNSSGVKYTGIFRDASDGRYKFYQGLQEEPTTTVNIAGTGYTRSDIECGNIYMGSMGTFYENGTARFRINGTQIQPLNGGRFDSGGSRLSSVGASTTGTDAINRDELTSGTFTLTNKTYSNPTFSGTGSSLSLGNNRLTAGSINSQAYYSQGNNFSFQLADAGFTVFQDKLLLGASSNTIYGDTSMSGGFFRSQHFRIPSNDFSIFSDGTNSYFTISGVDNAITSTIPHNFISQGVITNGILDSVTVPSDGIITNVTRFISVINLAATNTDRIVRRLTPSGTLLNCQRVELRNNTGNFLYIDNRATGSSGDFDCLPNTILHNRGSLMLTFNNTTNRWLVTGQDMKTIDERACVIRWSGDTVLSMKVRNTYTYRFALNFTNASGTITVNGVTFTNVNAMNYTSAGVDIAQNGSSIFFSGGPSASELTSTESAKLTKFIYNWAFLDFSLKGLTPTKYYELLIFVMVWDDLNRYWSLLDNMNTEYRINLKNCNHLEFVEGSVGSNEPALILSHIFRARGTSYDFRLDNNITGAHIYAMACIEHDYSFNPN